MKKFINIFVFIILLSFVFAPVVFAQAKIPIQDCAGLESAQGRIGVVLCRIAYFLNISIPILISLATVYFIWGVVNYVMGSSEDAKKEGKNRMIWGLIGLAVITSVWGLVALLKSFVIGDKPVTKPNIDFCIKSAGVDCD